MTKIKSTNQKISLKENVDGGSKKALKGFVLWGIVLAGYLLFCFNWMVMDNMKGIAGESGWYGSFFANKPGSLVDQAPNWTLTFMRGVGAFLAGWVLVKIGHKYSVTIALLLLAFGGIIGPLTGIADPLKVQSTGENRVFMFLLFLLFRMCMAVGATTLIVYTQPIIATYFNEKQKTITNLLNSFSFNVGSIIAIACMTYGAKEVMLSNWVAFTSGISAIAIILLILWLILAEPIAMPNDPSDQATYSSVLKESRTIKLSIMFGLWLTWVVLFLTMLPGYFITPIANASHRVLPGTAIGTWKIMFLLGLFGGIPAFTWISSKDWSRKPIIITTILIGIAFTFITALIGAYGMKEGKGFNTFLFYLTSFLAGMAGWGVQGYMLGTTYHYKEATPKKQGILIGSCWGIGYMSETLLTIFSSGIDSIVVAGGERDVTSAWIFIIVYLAYCLGAAIMWLFIPETHGKNPGIDSIHA